MHTRTTRQRLVAVALVATLAVAACGGDDDAGQDADADTTEAPVADTAGDPPGDTTGATSGAGDDGPGDTPADDGDQPAGDASELVILEGAEQPTLDPAKNIQYLSDEMHALYDTLVVILPDGSIGPNLAESWEVDGAEITFTLRQDVSFHDGTPFNAEAVKYNLDRVVDPATEATNSKAVLGPYASSEVIDEFTVKVTWERPVGGALIALANADLSIASPAAAEAGTLGDHPVGTGPYRFVEYTKGERLVVERNPDYTSIRPDLDNKGAPHYDRVVFQYVDNESTRANLISTGAADITQLAGPEAVRLSTSDLNLDTFPSISQHWISINTTVVPDIEVRRAIFAAIDREGIIAAVASGFGELNYSALPTILPGYDPTVESVQPAYDPDAAADILEAAGYTLNGDGVREKDGEPLSFQILSASDDPWPAIDQLVQDQLRQIGIDTTITTEEFATVSQTRRAGEQGMYIGRYGILDPAAHMTILFSCDTIPSPENPQGTNLSFFCNEDLDAALEAAGMESDEATRNELLSTAQFELAEDFTSLGLYQSLIAVFSQPDVTGISMQSDGILKINDIRPAGE